MADEGEEEDESDPDDEGVAISAFAALRQDHQREMKAERRQKERQQASLDFLKGFLLSLLSLPVPLPLCSSAPFH